MIVMKVKNKIENSYLITIKLILGSLGFLFMVIGFLLLAYIGLQIIK